ncbi:hypothetical protein L596_013411 [Steinernema carpocapsae]|uniref:Activin types I and II receptor domain-containing protein n=1 Tax=Steinernema carpocapsae TaxID=34508 RepID=A0A4U5P079_STECR|nr:hypothetical protein L596_013411 [Steinernema carpocapsae]
MFERKALVVLLLLETIQVAITVDCLCNENYWMYTCERRSHHEVGQCDGGHCIVAQSTILNKTITSYKCGRALIPKDECFSYTTNFGSQERVCYCRGKMCNTNQFLANYFKNLTQAGGKNITSRSVDDKEQERVENKDQDLGQPPHPGLEGTYPVRIDPQPIHEGQDRIQLYKMTNIEISIQDERYLLKWVLALLILCFIILLVLTVLYGCFLIRLYPFLPALRSLTIVEKIQHSKTEDKMDDGPLFIRNVKSPPPPYAKPQSAKSTKSVK